jgi:hypothetical protein
MGRLENLWCYLGCPIEFAANDYSSENVFFDKKKLVDFLYQKKVKVLDPKKISFNGVSEFNNRMELFAQKNFKEIRRQMKIIVRKDLRCVDKSDFSITYLPKGVRTTGSIHEIVNADNQKKPTLIICPEGIEHLPGWLFGIIPLEYMFDSVDDLIWYLDSVDREPHDDRWQFVLENMKDIETGF